MADAESIRWYFIQRQTEKNKYYKLLPKFDDYEVWNKIADKCRELNVTEKYLVDCIFDELKSTRYTIYPKSLLNSRFLNQVKFIQTNIGKDTQIDATEFVDREYDKAITTIKNFLKAHPDMSHSTVLRMDGFAIPAWLRMSFEPSDKRIRDKYYERAKMEVENINGLKEAIVSKGLNSSWL